MGMAMGSTAIAIIFSPFGKRSGAHFNPAVTLTYYRLGEVEPWDAAFYTLFQFVGGTAGVLVASLVLGNLVAHRSVNYAATVPGPKWSLARLSRGGQAYELRISATPGMRLSMTMMLGQSNDSFYAPDVSGVGLFDGKGNPVSGDVTEKFVLWDAGTEVNEELGIGPDQGPRQKAVNTGADEHGVVHRAKDLSFYTKTAELFRVTITPETGM